MTPSTPHEQAPIQAAIAYLTGKDWTVDYVLEGRRFAQLTCPRGGFAACSFTVWMWYEEDVVGSATVIRGWHDHHLVAHGD
jgi:hypothetical protein